MKLRQPKSTITPPREELPDRPTSAVWRESFQVTTLTPIYGGGTEAGVPDQILPVRVASIRGQLRFWWRLLKSHRRENPLQGKELFDEERNIWGGMSEGDDDHASKVKLRVHGISDFHPIPSLAFSQQQNDSALNYVLFSALTTGASLIPEGLRFTLDIECGKTCTPEQQHEIFETLRWWASFGGIGSRTRRGLGGIQVTGANSTLPPVSEDEASSHGCKLIQKSSRAKALEAWKGAVGPLWEFRQKPGIGRHHGRDSNHPGSSHWPEPDSIRAITGKHRIKADGTSFKPDNPEQREFPRAAFGLPIIFHFQNITRDKEDKRKDKQFDPGDCELKPQKFDRMASPLILKPIALDDGRYAPALLRLPLDQLSGLSLELQNSGADAHHPNLPYKLDRNDWWPTEPAAQQPKAQSIPPMWNHRGELIEGDGIDALAAFLKYFQP
ncbi:MAG: type III-B CRISPR module RAMP protein Cmr1 [Proteobacteria bacterium]|nr:type III-B CRISPR module RAMP protein Cmr1 [Pseudomonadota bacterium]